MFLLRPARTGDLADLLGLARLLDSVNLPHDEGALAEAIAASDAAFAGPHNVPAPGQFLFVMEHTGQRCVVGTSLIIASHGTVEDPHHSFQIETDERYSVTLQRLFRHRTLRLRRSYTPHTEIGGLVLSPDWRGHPARLGRTLSLARLVYIALNRTRFHDELQAELLPPLNSDGTSLLWECIGRHFTGLDYDEADRMSRLNREFITALFPTEPFYVSLLPHAVQRVLGAVGPGAKPVESMLRAVGFAPNNHIDPFDGGPHFAARTDAIDPVLSVRRVSARPANPGPDFRAGLVATPAAGPGFRATPSPFALVDSEALVPPETLDLLGLGPGDPVAIYAWPGSRSVET